MLKQNYFRLNSYLLAFYMVIASLPCVAADPIHRGVNIQTLLRRPDKSPVELSNVDINVKVLTGSTSTDCILLEENHSSQKIKNGMLQLILGKGKRLNATTTPQGSDPDKTLNQIFYNSAAIPSLNFADGSHGCTFADTTNTEPRIIRISFKDGQNDVVADFALRGSGNTVNSESLDGLGADKFVLNTSQTLQDSLTDLIANILDPIVDSANDGKSFRYNSSTGKLEAFTPLNSGSNLANNSVTNAAVSELSFAKLTSVPQPLSLTTGLKVCAANEILKFDGTNWNCATDDGGLVTSVAGRTGVVTLTTVDIADFSSAVDSRVASQRGASSGLASLGTTAKILAGELVTGVACANGQGYSYNSVTDSISCAVIGNNVSNASGLANGKLWIGDSSGKAQEVVMSAIGDLTVTNAGVTSLKAIGAGSNLTKVSVDAQGRVTGGAALVESDIPSLTLMGDVSDSHGANFVRKLRGNLVDGATPLDGQILSWDTSASRWKPNYLRMQDVLTSWGGTQVIAATPCLASETMVWTSVTNRFSCQAIANLSASTLSAGTIASARLPAASGTADGIVSQAAQNIAGVKTFLNNTVAQGTLTVTGALAANGGVSTTTLSASGNITTTGKGNFNRIKLGNSATSCSGASDEGKLRYNSTNKVMEFCNGTSWSSL